MRLSGLDFILYNFTYLDEKKAEFKVKDFTPEGLTYF